MVTASSRQICHSYLAWTGLDSCEETYVGKPISREPSDDENGGPLLQSVSHRSSPQSDASFRRSSDSNRQDINLIADFDGVHAGVLPNGYDDQPANLDPSRSIHPQASARPLPYTELTLFDDIIQYPDPVTLNGPDIPAITKEVHVARSAIPIVISLYFVLFTTGMQHSKIFQLKFFQSFAPGERRSHTARKSSGQTTKIQGRYESQDVGEIKE